MTAEMGAMKRVEGTRGKSRARSRRKPEGRFGGAGCFKSAVIGLLLILTAAVVIGTVSPGKEGGRGPEVPRDCSRAVEPETLNRVNGF